jgi:hypothetical protein
MTRSAPPSPVTKLTKLGLPEEGEEAEALSGPDLRHCARVLSYPCFVARRKAYTEVQKLNDARPGRADGKGDVVYRRFECMSPECVEVITVPDVNCGEEFAIPCPTCDYLHFDGGSVELFDYYLRDKRSKSEISHGPFAPTHRVYLDKAERVKYCLLCCTLQPLDNFGRHARREASQRQGECKMCKDLYNGLKNATRLTEQHREAADTRRLLKELSGETNVGDIPDLLDRFDHSCFKCGTELADHPGQEDGYYMDHTLPVSWLWPLDFGPTILCRTCNGEKGDRWPSEFYDGERTLRELATRTGIPFELLAGRPTFHPQAVEQIKAHPTKIIERWVKYPDKLKGLRTRILGATGEDVFSDADATALKAIGLNHG